MMKKRTLYQLITRNRSRIEKSENAGCISCHTIFPASEALKTPGYNERFNLKDADLNFSIVEYKEDVFCPKCRFGDCVVGDADLPDFDSFKRVVKYPRGSGTVAIEYAPISIEHPEKYKGKLYICQNLGIGLPEESYGVCLMAEGKPKPITVIEDGEPVVYPASFTGGPCKVEGKKTILVNASEETYSNIQEAREDAKRRYGVESTDWIPLHPEFPAPIFPQEDEVTDTDQPHLTLDQDSDDWTPDDD